MGTCKAWEWNSVTKQCVIVDNEAGLLSGSNADGNSANVQCNIRNPAITPIVGVIYIKSTGKCTQTSGGSASTGNIDKGLTTDTICKYHCDAKADCTSYQFKTPNSCVIFTETAAQQGDSATTGE